MTPFLPFPEWQELNQSNPSNRKEVMMMNLPLNIDFTGKVVVVTGAGGILCGTMAQAFAQAGAKVAALDLNEEAVKKLAADLKAEGLVCEGLQGQRA